MRVLSTDIMIDIPSTEKEVVVVELRIFCEMHMLCCHRSNVVILVEEEYRPSSPRFPQSSLCGSQKNRQDLC